MFNFSRGVRRPAPAGPSNTVGAIAGRPLMNGDTAGIQPRTAPAGPSFGDSIGAMLDGHSPGISQYLGFPGGAPNTAMSSPLANAAMSSHFGQLLGRLPGGNPFQPGGAPNPAAGGSGAVSAGSPIDQHTGQPTNIQSYFQGGGDLGSLIAGHAGNGPLPATAPNSGGGPGSPTAGGSLPFPASHMSWAAGLTPSSTPPASPAGSPAPGSSFTFGASGPTATPASPGYVTGPSLGVLAPGTNGPVNPFATSGVGGFGIPAPGPASSPSGGSAFMGAAGHATGPGSPFGSAGGGFVTGPSLGPLSPTGAPGVGGSGIQAPGPSSFGGPATGSITGMLMGRPGQPNGAPGGLQSRQPGGLLSQLLNRQQPQPNDAQNGGPGFRPPMQSDY